MFDKTKTYTCPTVGGCYTATTVPYPGLPTTPSTPVVQSIWTETKDTVAKGYKDHLLKDAFPNYTIDECALTCISD